MDKALIEAIAAILALPREKLMPELDKIEQAGGPLVARKVQSLRTFANKVWDSLPNKAAEGFAEVLQLIKTGSGPSVHDDADAA